MSLAQDRGQTPLKCFAKKGSNCVNAVMKKVMMCDESRIHHHPMCIGGTDFGDCYDQIAHPPASRALQSWGVPQKSVCLILMAMQTMQFFLWTGYGESAETYGGSIEDRTLGLGQGNAAAGPGFMALSAQIVNAYLRDEHRSCMMTCYTFCLFALAAVLYVDDTDLIHMTALVTAMPSDLVQQSQISTNAWQGLAIATGASLKPEKCFSYFQVYKFPGRCAAPGNILTQYPATNFIPQLTGPPLPVSPNSPTTRWHLGSDPHNPNIGSFSNVRDMVWPNIQRN